MFVPFVISPASHPSEHTMSPVATNGNDRTQQAILQKTKIDDEKHAVRERARKTHDPFPKPPTFVDKLEERAYLKFRLAQAFRIFGNLGYDEGVAGHITVRVCQCVHCVSSGRVLSRRDVGPDST